MRCIAPAAASRAERTPGTSLFFFNDTATTEIYTLSLHDALPISVRRPLPAALPLQRAGLMPRRVRSEEHTSELQSREKFVCRLLLEKTKIDICGVVLLARDIAIWWFLWVPNWR